MKPGIISIALSSPLVSWVHESRHGADVGQANAATVGGGGTAVRQVVPRRARGVGETVALLRSTDVKGAMLLALVTVQLAAPVERPMTRASVAHKLLYLLRTWPTYFLYKH